MSDASYALLEFLVFVVFVVFLTGVLVGVVVSENVDCTRSYALMSSLRAVASQESIVDSGIPVNEAARDLADSRVDSFLL